MRRLLVPSLASLFSLLVAAPVALAPPRSFDLLFHLAFGRYWLDHGFPDHDPFSFTAPAKWFPHEWTFGVAAELSVRAFGAAGPQLLTAFLLVALFALLWRGMKPNQGLFATLAFVLALAAQSYTWEEARPFHLGHALFAVAVLILRRTGAPVSDRPFSTTFAAAYLLLTIAWANLHGSWVLAPALLAGTALGLFLEGSRRDALFTAALALVAWLAAALSPGGLSTLVYPITHALLPSTQTIQEWQPFELDRWGFALLLLAALFAWFSLRSRAWSLAVPALGLFAAALSAQRHAPFAAILLAIGIARLAPSDWRASNPFTRALARIDASLRAWSDRAGGLLWPLAALVIISASAATHPRPLHDALPRDDFPMTALDALAPLPPGRVLTRFQWGGAVEYLAGDGHPVFIDARNDLFPLQIHDDYRRLALLEPGWHDVLDRHAPRYILWGASSYGWRLLDALHKDPAWRVVAEDATGSLFVRSDDALAP